MGDLGPAKAGFPAPDGDDDGSRNAIALLDPGKRARVLLHQRPSGGRQALKALFTEIGAGTAEFGLALGAGLRLWKPRRGQIRQIPIEIDACKGAIENRLGNAGAFGVKPQIGLQPLAELRLDGGL